jgi:hypothetical protein
LNKKATDNTIRFHSGGGDSKSVKSVKRAPEQAAVLNALQEAGWPATPVKLLNWQTLHITLNRLNKKATDNTIRFHSGGDSKSVKWTKCKKV